MNSLPIETTPCWGVLSENQSSDDAPWPCLGTSGKALGGLPRTRQQKLAQLAGRKSRAIEGRAGMRFIRQCEGTAHAVTIGEDWIICWNDREWRSLREVARRITGTRWSGPAFFGLKQRLAG
ncbi:MULTISPECIES: DUF2924 domain-containing protein [unclassified Sphingobium]|uniref:DUF2924 domain-containing protein n=1 Tax=unclassified Sphingobium TaxID=2611147 RepID=UPI001F1BBDD5|nr:MULTISPECIES: DUF2924 domain-containing protein [unclassified Sphingobium]